MTPCLTLLFITLLTVAMQAAQPMRVGWARVDITPPPGMRLCGSFNERLATGTHDPLWVRAFVFEQGGVKLALAGCDLGMISPAVCDAVRTAVRDLGLEPEHVLIHASETHNGPAFYWEVGRVFHERAVRELGHDPAEPVDYPKLLAGRIAEAIRAADRSLATATLSWAEGRCEGLAFNRRYVMKDGRIGWNPGKLNPDIVRPAGPVQDRVPLLVFQRDEKPAALLTGFAMHLAILDCLEYAADYPFHLGQKLRAELGSDFFTHFLQAPCAEVNHIDVSHDRSQIGHVEAQRVGEKLAATVLAMIPALRPLPAPRLAAASSQVELRVQSFSAEETARERVRFQDLGRAKMSLLEMAHTSRVIAIADRHRSGPVTVRVQAFRLDEDTALLGLPSEVSVEFGLRITRESPFKHQLIVQLSNDWLGYIPPRHMFEEGGYESAVAHIAPGEGEHLTAAALKLLRELHAQP
jgi:hypothetical protein